MGKERREERKMEEKESDRVGEKEGGVKERIVGEKGKKRERDKWLWRKG